MTTQKLPATPATPTPTASTPGTAYEAARRATRRALAAGRRGMTLIEIMVVIAIIGIVSSAIGVGVVAYLNKAKVDACRAQIRKVAGAVTLYAAENDYPSDLRALLEQKLVKEKDLKDQWKEELIYSYPSSSDDKEFDLCSKGPDKVEGNEDDICND